MLKGEFWVTSKVEGYEIRLVRQITGKGNFFIPIIAVSFRIVTHLYE